MTSKRSFTEGDTVLVSIPQDIMTMTSPVLTFDKTRQVISRVAPTYKDASGFYVELEGVVSEFGIPFAFLNSWLTKVPSAKRTAV